MLTTTVAAFRFQSGMEVVSGITSAERSPVGVGMSSGTGQPSVASVMETNIARRKIALVHRCEIAVRSLDFLYLEIVLTSMKGRTTSVETISASSSSLPLAGVGNIDVDLETVIHKLAAQCLFTQTRQRTAEKLLSPTTISRVIVRRLECSQLLLGVEHQAQNVRYLHLGEAAFAFDRHTTWDDGAQGLPSSAAAISATAWLYSGVASPSQRQALSAFCISRTPALVCGLVAIARGTQRMRYLLSLGICACRHVHQWQRDRILMLPSG